MKSKVIPESLYFHALEPQPRKGDRRKIQILEALIDCIATDGLDSTSFDTIGKALKMKRSHVAYYYPNRDELIRSAIRYTVSIGQSIVQEEISKVTGWREKMTAHMRGHFRWLTENPKHTAVMLMFYSQCLPGSEYRELQTTIRRIGEDRLRGCLESLVERALLTEKSAREVARSIQNLMTGALLFFYISEYPTSFKELEQQTLKATFQLIEAAVRTKKV